MDRGAWWAILHGVAKSQTQLNDFTFTYMNRSELLRMYSMGRLDSTKTYRVMSLTLDIIRQRYTNQLPFPYTICAGLCCGVLGSTILTSQNKTFDITPKIFFQFLKLSYNVLKILMPIPDIVSSLII